MKEVFKNEKDALRKIISMVCNGYIDTIMTAIEEDNTKDFPYTIVCANFIAELKEKNIIVELVGTFEDTIIDRIFRDVSNYLVR